MELTFHNETVNLLYDQLNKTLNRLPFPVHDVSMVINEQLRTSIQARVYVSSDKHGNKSPNNGWLILHLRAREGYDPKMYIVQVR